MRPSPPSRLSMSVVHDIVLLGSPVDGTTLRGCMKGLLALLALATAAAPAAASAQVASGAGVATPVVMDGRFDDWTDAGVLIRDPVDAHPSSPTDLLFVAARDDARWLYLNLGVEGRVNLQAMRGTLHLVVDADGDPATGGPAFGVEGAEYVLELSPRGEEPDAPEVGAGFAVRPVGSAGPGPRRPAYDVGAAGLPTWASNRFELRLARAGASDGFGRLGDRVRVKLVAIGPAGVGDETEAAPYVFTTAAEPATPVADLAPLVDRAPGSIRVAQWNVSEGSFRTPEVHARLLAAVRPDVVLLDEVHEEVSDASLAAFFAHPDLAALGTWRWTHALGGGRQKTVVATRDLPLRAEPSMARVAYAPQDLERLRPLVPAAFHRALDLEARIGMSATGAWVEVDGTEILFVPLDLQSAGWLGSPHDLLREVQATTLLRHVRAALDAVGTDTSGRRRPVVVGGDVNAVGGYAPVEILARGLDVDASDLTVAEPRRLGEPSLFTWYDPRRGPFTPGRLDLTLYADAALEATGGFVFDTADLTDAQLARLGLARAMSAQVSDHLIVVTDLRVR